MISKSQLQILGMRGRGNSAEESSDCNSLKQLSNKTMLENLSGTLQGSNWYPAPWRQCKCFYRASIKRALPKISLLLGQYTLIIYSSVKNYKTDNCWLLHFLLFKMHGKGGKEVSIMHRCVKCYQIPMRRKVVCSQQRNTMQLKKPVGRKNRIASNTKQDLNRLHC